MKRFLPFSFHRRPETEMVREAESFYRRIARRRTLRSFATDPVPQAVIDNAIRSAGSAPSGANLQPWHFVIVTDQGKKRQIRQEAEKRETAFYSERAPEEWLQALEPLGTNATKSFLEEAPVLIAVFLKKSVVRNGQRQKTYYPVESVGLATGILITALHFSGLALLTYTPSPMGFLNTLLDRPDSERPYMLIVCGYPASGSQVPDISRRPFHEIVTRFPPSPLKEKNQDCADGI